MGFLSRVVERWRRTPAHGAPVARRVVRGPLLDYARQPDPAWQAALDAATMVGDGTQVARLWLHWVPGDPWQPVHRWFVFQLQPWAHVETHIQAELRGPHPRTNARLEHVWRVIDGQKLLRPAVRGGPCRFVDRTQWALHRQLEREQGVLVFPRYTWVIQGDAGGHPFAVGSEESAWRVAQGLPPDTPSAGDLPYAPFDQRVLDALVSYDLWRYAHGASDPLTATAAVRIARQHALEMAANRLTWARKEAVAGEIADELAHVARKELLHYHRWQPVGATSRPVDWDAMKEDYITSTTFTD